MARADIISKLYSRTRTPLEFNYDNVIAPPLFSLITVDDVEALRETALSIRLSSKPKKKYEIMDNILRNRGFVRYHAGTNRLVYRHLENQNIILKVAFGDVGMNDSPSEYKNQFLIQPFCTKVFEVSPCGTVGLFERVDPITSVQEFTSVADDIFEMINKCILGKVVLEDFGTIAYLNWGMRKGFGPVILDFPYVFELDGDKLFCNKYIEETNSICDGEIDYDDGYNILVCGKCGTTYFARELQKAIDDKVMVVRKRGAVNMGKVQVTRGTDVIYESETGVKAIEPPKVKSENKRGPGAVAISNWKPKNGTPKAVNNSTREELESVATTMRDIKKKSFNNPIITGREEYKEDAKPDETEDPLQSIVEATVAAMEAASDDYEATDEREDEESDMPIGETTANAILDMLRPNEEPMEQCNPQMRNIRDQSSDNEESEV